MVHNPKIGVYWLMAHMHQPAPRIVSVAMRQRSKQSLDELCSKSKVRNIFLSVIQRLKNYYFQSSLKKTTMKNQSYKNIHNLTANDVIYCDNIDQVKYWYKGFSIAEKRANNSRISYEEKQRIRVFKKALSMKYNTFQLLRVIDLKEKACWPYSTKEYAFYKTAKEMLDEKTYNEVIGRCDFKQKYATEGNSMASKNSQIIFYEALKINTIDVMNTTDINLLTTWSVHVLFTLNELYQNKNQDDESNYQCKLTYTFDKFIRNRLHTLKKEMREDAGMMDWEISEKFFNYVTGRFCSEAEAYLPCNVFEEIYSASEAYLKEIKNSDFKTASKKMAV